MSKNKIELLLGLLLVIMPFTGFPPAWKTSFYILAGIVLILIAVAAHVKRRSIIMDIHRETDSNGTA